MSTDAKAADQFQPTHRAGYGDRLAFLMQWLTDHPDATLASGEGRVLRDEINRVRVVAQANYANMERLGAEVERLRETLDRVHALIDSPPPGHQFYMVYTDDLLRALGRTKEHG